MLLPSPQLILAVTRAVVLGWDVKASLELDRMVNRYATNGVGLGWGGVGCMSSFFISSVK